MSDSSSHIMSAQIRIGGARVDSISLASLMRRLDKMIEDGKSHYVCFCEAHLCVRATFEEDMRCILEKSSLVLPDGVSMTLGARLLGEKLPDRLPGPLVMIEYCRHGIKKDVRHFFYGGADGVAERLATRLQQQIPGISIAGIYSPPFGPLTQEEERKIIKTIEESGADVLWVGLGAPKQERWMFEHVGKIRVPLMLGVGAAFDFHSGNRKWAPTWIRKAGLEWVYRMFTSGRIFRRGLTILPLFMLIVMKQTIFTLLGFYRKPNQVG